MTGATLKRSPPKLRVLVVDDSRAVQRLVKAVIDAEPELDVVAVASGGTEALELVEQFLPDRLLLDLSMPGMDGAELYTVLRTRFPQLPVVVFTGNHPPTTGGLGRAIATGEVPMVSKPTGVSDVEEAFARLRTTLIPALRSGRQPAPQATSKPKRSRSGAIDALLVGASTGGPRALERILGSSLEPLSVPTFVVQHIAEGFSPQLANQLGRTYPGPVSVAAHGDQPQPGHVYIAPGGRHLELVSTDGSTTVRLHDGPAVNSCRPSVDVLFNSAASVYGRNQLAVVLTGMGQDGLAGCRTLSSKRARIVVQDKSSSVIWGMPGAVVEAGLADGVVPLDELGPRIVRWIRDPGSLDRTQ